MLETETKALLPNPPSLTPLPLVNAKHSALGKCPGNSVLQDCPKWSLGKTTILDRGWSSPWRECTFPWIRVGGGQSRAEIEDPWGSQEERKAISLLSCLRELASRLQDRRLLRKFSLPIYQGLSWTLWNGRDKRWQEGCFLPEWVRPRSKGKKWCQDTLDFWLNIIVSINNYSQF